MCIRDRNKTQAPLRSNGRELQEHLGEQGPEGPTDCSFPATGCDSDDSMPHDSVVDSKREASTEKPAAGQWAVYFFHPGHVIERSSMAEQMPASKSQVGELDPSSPVFFPNQQQSHEQQADSGRRASINALTENSNLRRSARLRERAQAQLHNQSVPSDQAFVVTASSEQAHCSQQTSGDGESSEWPTSQLQDNGDQNQMPSLAEVEINVAVMFLLWGSRPT